MRDVIEVGTNYAEDSRINTDRQRQELLAGGTVNLVRDDVQQKELKYRVSCKSLRNCPPCGERFMNPKIKVILSYAAGLILVTAAYLLRVAIEGLLGPGLPTFVTFYPVIMVVALLLGPGPGLLVSAYTLFIADYFIITPYSFENRSPIETVSLFLFALMCILMNLVAHHYRRNRDRLEQMVASRTAALSSANEALSRQIEAYHVSENALIEERKNIQRAKEEWERTFDSVPDLIALLDNRHRIVRLNRAMAERLHREPSQCIGLPCYTLMHNTDAPPAYCPLSKTLSKGGMHEEELHEVVFGGDYLVTTTPLHDNEGNIYATVHVARDITKLKQSENALREKEERLRFHMENSPMAVIEWDKNFIVTRWSGESERTFGWSAAETVGKPITSLNMIFEDDMPLVENTISRLTDGISRHAVATNRNYTKNGDIRYCTWYNSVLLDQQGEMSSVLSKVIDITELKWAEQERQKFVSLADHSTEFIGMCDMNMAPFYINDAGMREVGLDNRDEFLHLSVLDFYFPEDHQFISEIFYPAVLKDGRSEVEIRFRHFKTGEPIWMLHSAFYIRDIEGQPVGLATVSRNIHQSKQAQEALSRAHDELELRVAERTMALADSVRLLEEEIAVRQRTERSLQHLNQLYAVLSETNQATVRSSDRDRDRYRDRDRDRGAMFRDFCRIAVEHGGFLLAWIGELNASTGEIQIVAAHGAISYLSDIRISANEEPSGEGPTGIAIRTGTYHICNDFQNASCTVPWHEKGREHGFCASASIALKEEGQVIGALTLYAGETDYFDQQHIDLLVQMGNDISFALDNIIREVQRNEAVHLLQEETLQRLQATETLRKQELLLMQQSRQAAMGEMIGNIAHQWRQPLNTLGLFTQRIGYFYGSPSFDKEFLDDSVAKSMEIIQYMSKTIDDFRSFFSTDREKSDFRVDTAVSKALSLVEASFKDRSIHVERDVAEDIVIYGFPNEYAQVLLNILINAKDALLERNIEFPRVKISGTSEYGVSVVSISDNAGGIPEEILSKVFDPYFTTKGPQQGTGVGLFMSRSIIENNMGGKISACNTAEGAEFRIEV